MAASKVRFAGLPVRLRVAASLASLRAVFCRDGEYDADRQEHG